MDYDEYVNKMIEVLGNGDKFMKLRHNKTCDRTKSIKLNFQKWTLGLVNDKVLTYSENVYIHFFLIQFPFKNILTL